MTSKLTADDFRISDVFEALVNNRKVILFTARKREGDTFVHIGQFTAPLRTPKSALWRIASEA